MEYFIIGVLFALIGIPILESLVELVQMWIEKSKAKCAVAIAKMNKEATGNEKSDTYVIGFQAPEEEVEELEEDDDF